MEDSKIGVGFYFVLFLFIASFFVGDGTSTIIACIFPLLIYLIVKVKGFRLIGIILLVILFNLFSWADEAELKRSVDSYRSSYTPTYSSPTTSTKPDKKPSYYSSYSSSSKSTSDYDDVYDYDDPDDFYDAHYGDFEDYEEAEDYWYDYN